MPFGPERDAGTISAIAASVYTRIATHGVRYLGCTVRRMFGNCRCCPIE